MGAKKHIPIVIYPGALGEPHVRIRRDSFILTLLSPRPEKTDAERQEEADKKNLDALVEKLDLLAAYYTAIDGKTINWQKLAIGLAFTHVPGFTTVDEKPR